MGNTIKIQQLSYDDLTNEEKREASDNGIGKEYADYIKITRFDKTILLESDAMEPEDITFSRDLGWIIPTLQKMYDLGLEDGKHIT